MRTRIVPDVDAADLERAHGIASDLAGLAAGNPEHTRIGELMEMKQQLAALTGVAKTRHHRAPDRKRIDKRKHAKASRKANRRC